MKRSVSCEYVVIGPEILHITMTLKKAYDRFINALKKD